MKNRLLIFLIVLSASCGNKKKESLPDYVISKQKMIELTVDLKLIESSINLNHYNKITDKKTIDSLYLSVYNKHNFTRTDIDTSLSYYTKKPELLQAIYDSTLVILNKINLL